MPCRPAEPTLTDALSDGIVQAMMKADGVDPAGLEALLGRVARRRGPAVARRPAPAPIGAPDCAGGIPPAEHRAGS